MVTKKENTRLQEKKSRKFKIQVLVKKENYKKKELKISNEKNEITEKMNVCAIFFPWSCFTFKNTKINKRKWKGKKRKVG
jgi:hypothetical protein